MRKAAPAKESGLEVMQAQSSRKTRPIARVELVSPRPRMYRLTVTVNPVAGFGDPNIKLAQQRPKSIARRFFTSEAMLDGGCAWETERSAGCQLARFANLRTVASNDRLATVGGGSESQVGADPMHTPPRNPSVLQQRAAAHRAMALAALRADSSLSVRLKRYNAAMARARALEAEAAEQQITATRAPRTALAWINLADSRRADTVKG